MALYGKVKPCPRYAHAVPTADGLTVKPQIFCFAVQGRRIQFRRLSANRFPLFAVCPLAVVVRNFILPVAVAWAVGCLALALLGSRLGVAVALLGVVPCTYKAN